MNKLARKITAAGMCAALSLGCVCAAFAQPAGRRSAYAAPARDGAQQLSEKEETVYVLAGADGSAEEIIVSDWLKNPDGSAKLYDCSELTDIENVKGDEGYTASGSSLVWDARGRDIYYQGRTEKELPVSLTVTYTLDGRTVTPEELAGKSGKVAIRFDYKSRRYETVEINGVREKIYVPFAAITGVVLDNSVFGNVEISNGKLINDGDRTIAVGLAFPGLQEDLAPGSESTFFPDYVEITADASQLELGMTVTLISNELFGAADTEKLDALDAVGLLSALTEGVQALLDGSSELYDGLCTLLDSANELSEGVDSIASGAGELASGAAALGGGAAELSAGAESLVSGLNTLAANSAGLNSGAQQVFSGLLSMATGQIRAAGISIPDLTAGNYAEVLEGVISSIDENAVYSQALAQVTAAVEASRTEITEKVTSAVQEQVAQQVTAAVQAEVLAGITAAVREQIAAQVIPAVTGMSKDEYDAAAAAGTISPELQAQVEAAVEERMAATDVQQTIQDSLERKMADAEIQAMISSGTASQMQTDAVQLLIAQNVEAQIQQAIASTMASDAVQSQLAAASEGAQTVIALKTSLDSYNAFYLGLAAYTGGVDSAASGAASLFEGADSIKEGADSLSAGASALYSGALTMQGGMPALIDGITALRDGALELSDGLKQLSEEGVQKLTEELDGDLDGVAARLSAAVTAAKNYRSFSGTDSAAPGQVRFVWRTDGIKMK